MKLALAILLCHLSALAAALRGDEIQLASVFSNHIVLQRELPVPIWGWSNPGEEVTVDFAGQKKSTKADDSGKWLVRLDPMPASAEGRELRVESAAENRVSKITDVVVGDVWLCSGQSNMHFQMSGVWNSRDEIDSADHPDIRFFKVKAQFSQTPMVDLEGVWKPVSPETAGECSAVAYYFARTLKEQVGVPIGLLVSSVGGTRIESWMQPETLSRVGLSGRLVDQWKNVSAEEFKKIAANYSAYQYERDHVYSLAVRSAKARGASVPPEPRMPKMRCHDCPGALHCGMIAPLQQFAIRGVVWYQGESNSGQPAPYEKLLPAMIADWRQVWGAELPFLFVQLAPHRNIHPAFREAQHRIWQKTPHTAMVVTTDVGDINNIHPTRKRPVGERLALAARALSYGEQLEFSGPIFKDLEIDGNRAIVSFTHVGEGLVAEGGPLKGFTIAGADGTFTPANAVIEGATVIVTSDNITEPTAVRYAWAKALDVNFFNREGLPAAPFRSDVPSDRVPIVTQE